MEDLVMCQGYTLDGEIYNFMHPYKIFRKHTNNLNETSICRILKQHPHPNCVRIYDVQGKVIDMEYLDTNIRVMKQKNINGNKMIQDVEKALEHLRKYNIIYIDLKIDNIGYCHKDKCFKLFDFDMSGMKKIKSNEWFLVPNKGYIFREYLKLHNNDGKQLNIDNIDIYAMEEFRKLHLNSLN